MTIDIEEFDRIKKKVAKAKTDHDRAQGAYDEQMKKLKEEFGVDTIEDAEKLLVDLEKEEKQFEEEYNEAKKEFEEKWGDKI